MASLCVLRFVLHEADELPRHAGLQEGSVDAIGVHVRYALVGIEATLNSAVR